MAVKTYAPHLTAIVRIACHYITKYRAKLEQTITTVVTNTTQRAQIIAWLDATVAVCSIMEAYWPQS